MSTHAYFNFGACTCHYLGKEEPITVSVATSTEFDMCIGSISINQCLNNAYALKQLLY